MHFIKNQKKIEICALFLLLTITLTSHADDNGEPISYENPKVIGTFYFKNSKTGATEYQGFAVAESPKMGIIFPKLQKPEVAETIERFRKGKVRCKPVNERFRSILSDSYRQATINLTYVDVMANEAKSEEDFEVIRGLKIMAEFYREANDRIWYACK